MNNKRGSTSVFLVFILTSMIFLIAAFIYAAKEISSESYEDGLLGLASRSVLSEFHTELKERYDIFAFESHGMEAERDIRGYMNEALRLNGGRHLEKTDVSFGDYSLGNPEVLKEQILDYMKFAIAEELLVPSRDSDPAEKKGAGRTLRNSRIIESLPSEPLNTQGIGFLEWVKDITSQVGSIEKIFDETKDSYLINRYILSHFKYQTGGPQNDSTFFENEVEYILEGNYRNQTNYANVRKGLVIFRSSLNAIYLYANPRRRAETLAAAELLTPGPAAVVTQAVLIGTWSLAEAENDARLLEKKKPVALFKDDATWATDLQSVIDNKEQGCIDTKSGKGLYYDDYLMIFLHFQDEELKLMRTMDLIQINMKGSCDKDFLIRTCHCGFYLQAVIKGKEYGYEAVY